ncbi:MAG: class I SAM-dependent methyltransferase [Elusimicrobiota bacterium]|jgi:SAM-dependent methyltransferase|nr:class I SAM-dependent methyltransferase [Elusimicrobiota bacterium]
MNFKFLFKNPNDWYIKDYCYFKKDNQGIFSAWSNDYQDMYDDIDAVSWWVAYRIKIVNSLMKKYFARQTDSLLVADIGGANGYISKKLMDNGWRMLLIEPTVRACFNAKKHGVDNVICGHINDEDFNSNILDSCLMLDVIEHVENDIEALKCINDKMKKGSRFILTTSAFQSLWSSHDVESGHFRRYSIKELSVKFKKAGFKVIYKSYFLSFLYFPILLICFFEKLGLVKKQNEINPKEKHKQIKGRSSANKLTVVVLNILNAIERICLRCKIKIPLGSSVIFVVEK